MKTEERPIVRFDNRRIFNKLIRGSSTRSFKNKYGQEIDFRFIPLYEPELDGEGNLVPQVDHEGKAVVWGEILDLTKRNSITLHPVVHHDVIKHIRELPYVRSSKKSDPKSNPIQAQIIEFEPEVQEKENFKQAMVKISAISMLGMLFQDKHYKEFELTCAALRIGDQNRIARFNALQARIEQSPESFMTIFANKEMPEFHPEQVGEFYVRLAIQHKVITMNKERSAYFFNGENLGPDAGKIAGKYSDMLPSIIAELDDKYFAAIREDLGIPEDVPVTPKKAPKKESKKDDDGE